MANTVGGKCSSCGKILKNGLKYSSKGRLFCFDCYQKEASRLMQEQSKQKTIYEYIKKLFKVTSLSSVVVDGIDRCLKDGLTEDNIIYTLYYVYEINNAELDLSFIIANIKRYYEEALKFKQGQDRILEINKNISIKPETVTIKIKKSCLDEESKPKFTYNMEDL